MKHEGIIYVVVNIYLHLHKFYIPGLLLHKTSFILFKEDDLIKFYLSEYVSTDKRL